MDWQLTCRVCLESGDMVSLFDWDENNEQLSAKYAYCCGVEVTKDDNFPTLICLNCVDRLTFSYQFKQQCLSSNETLKECMDEFLKTSASAKESGGSSKTGDTEVITVKQENGVLYQYELPIENAGLWTRTLTKSAGKGVISKAPGPKKRGRPRKYPDEDGHIDISPYQRKKAKVAKKEPKSLTSLLEEAESGDLKEEPEDSAADDPFSADDDTEYNPDEDEEKPSGATPRKRGRPRKDAEPGEDMLLQETILALSEPIPESVLQPRAKPKKKYPRKRYKYEKTHVCETCGASFASNASLQAHIRRHLGIKPFVCSVCGFSCVTREALKRHMVRHTGERPYPCRICERAFGDFGTRQKHERLHMGVRPYTCSVCGKSFTYSYVLSNHMLTHTGEKKYLCTPCNKKFTKAHHLKYHNKVHHKELYLKQEIEAQAKRQRQQMKIANITASGGQILINDTIAMQEARLQVVQEEAEGEAEGAEEAGEGEEDGEYAEQETDRAVACMQAEELGSELYITDEDQITPD